MSTAIHLGIGFTADPKNKALESEIIAEQIKVYLAAGHKIDYCLDKPRQVLTWGKARGKMTAAERERESRRLQADKPNLLKK